MEGYSKGEICNRDGCVGVIDEHDLDGGCSCHINPPCSYCETPKEYCPVCGWDAREEKDSYEKRYAPSEDQLKKWELEREERRKRDDEFYKRWRGELPIEKYEDRHEFHTHFTMIKFGVYPDSMTMDDVRLIVDGSFGGRFERFGNGRFKFIAYTD
jgi:hypothetical protein